MLAKHVALHLGFQPKNKKSLPIRQALSSVFYSAVAEYFYIPHPFKVGPKAHFVRFPQKWIRFTHFS
jgi:hypothetical protein